MARVTSPIAQEAAAAAAAAEAEAEAEAAAGWVAFMAVRAEVSSPRPHSVRPPCGESLLQPAVS